MGSSKPSLYLIFSLLPHLCICGPIFSNLIFPNFTATNLDFVDNGGVFLSSINNTYSASIYNPAGDNNFYLCVLHTSSNRLIWSADRDTPISNFGQLSLTRGGFSLYRDDGTLAWSAGILAREVSGLQLKDSGNLVLLDTSNRTLWQSFDYPTDTVLIGQPLVTGKSIIASTSGANPTSGDYSVSVSEADLSAIWSGQKYWSLANDPIATKDANGRVTQMAVNSSGLYLLSGEPGSPDVVVIWQVSLPAAAFRLATVYPDSRFAVLSFASGSWNEDFVRPDDPCSCPLACGSIGLCRTSAGAGSPYCSCPSSFPAADSADPSHGCTPPISAPSCASNKSIEYLSFGTRVTYFATRYSEPIESVNQSGCEALCTGNCTCRGFFYSNQTGFCFLLRDRVGSVRVGDDSRSSGYLKVLAAIEDGHRVDSEAVPLVAFILAPIGGALLITAILAGGITWWRKTSSKPVAKKAAKMVDSDSDLEFKLIPGLPVRFSFSELELATEHFKNQIGSGGFGAVYKGVLPDTTVVAVKRINSVGIQGKREFYTEIATIGSIHHVNLVRLRGFCTKGAQRLLVYEYMNLGSLDRTLFEGGARVLGWGERVEISLGAARGLAYLHGGCRQKIIHCDVKPENILLNDSGEVKLSDFGLSKLLTREQSEMFTTMRGTRGYLAPEWLTTAAISEKTDVYSFGMVLLEIVRGRKNCLGGGGGQYFPMLALEMHENGRYMELVDPRLGGEVDAEEVRRVVRVALCCVHQEPALRPSMAAVVAMLEGRVEVGEPRVESLTFLRFYGRRFSEPSRLGSESERGPNHGTASSSGSLAPTTLTEYYISAQEVYHEAVCYMSVMLDR
ncbi:hypothetical protein AMTR_s00008p00036610 [Amborella trichopoda]|uniref:Receptor-like serine/threonine-protein kinase n=1 Tax=Amborella trichopoda TaxID=13333 RepID=W1NII4_AMBTC|nr:hypothetical protein AMTR_s00008p00036610 [Amborella trichopoda]